MEVALTGEHLVQKLLVEMSRHCSRELASYIYDAMTMQLQVKIRAESDVMLYFLLHTYYQIRFCY